MGLFPFTHSWKLTILIGEMAAVFYVVIRGTLFRAPLFQKTEFFNIHMRSMLFMSATQLIAALMLNADRILLKVFAGGTAVTVFYVATLIGKILSLVTTPLNSVLIGHLTKSDRKMSGARYGALCLAGILAGCVLSVLCVGISYLFVKLMYPNVFALARPYFWLGNASQVLYFVSNTLTVVLLRYADEKYQLYINLIYLALFLVIALPLVQMYAIWGMAISLIAANGCKVLLIAVWGSRILKRQEKESV